MMSAVMLGKLSKVFISWHACFGQVITDVADTSLLVLSFSAEIRARLWKKNGQSMNDQVEEENETFVHVTENSLDVTHRTYCTVLP